MTKPSKPDDSKKPATPKPASRRDAHRAGETTPSSPPSRDDKQADLELFRQREPQPVLTTDQGIPIPHTDDSLKAGPRGPTLLEDFHLREKITRFDHERIPERVVHARGSGAHGHFTLTRSLKKYTTAKILTEVGVKTPLFTRFSTVA